jgi:hypothetical protein
MPALILWLVTGAVTAFGGILVRLGWKKVTGLDARKGQSLFEDIDPFVDDRQL